MAGASSVGGGKDNKEELATPYFKVGLFSTKFCVFVSVLVVFVWVC